MMFFVPKPSMYSQDNEKGLSIDEMTGEAWISEGVPPPRVNHLSTPFYNSLSDEALWHELSQFDPIAVVGLKLPNLERGVFRGTVLLGNNDIEVIRGKILALEGIEEYVSKEENTFPVMVDGTSYPALLLPKSNQSKRFQYYVR